MDPGKYRLTLVNINKKLRPNELETMKFMLSQHNIPKRRMEEIKSALQLFDVMEERDLLGADNLVLLRQLLIDSTEGRTDLVNILDNAVNGSVAPNSQAKPHGAQPANNLSAEFEYLSDHLGKAWRRMCRRLPGIKEPDIDAAVEHHQRNLQEQIMHILKLWQSRNPMTASRKDLIDACMQSEMRLHAENIAEQNFT